MDEETRDELWALEQECDSEIFDLKKRVKILEDKIN